MITFPQGRPGAPARRSLRGAGAAFAAGILVAGCAGAQAIAPMPPERPETQAAGRQAATAAPAAFSPLPPRRLERPSPEAFAAWREGFRARALAEGIRAAVFDAAFSGVTPDPEIIRLDRRQPEFTRQIWEYLDSAVSPERIANGRAAFRRHADALARIEAEHGVDAAVIVAIWGLESAYGGFRGTTPVIRGLATLAFDGRRRAFFEGELIAALRILQSGVVSPGAMIGSWAGAMGHTQFMPSSYLAHAADGTGDGRIDIWSDDPTDALASAASYLAAFGWERGAPTVRRVRLPAGFDYALADQDIRRPVAAWEGLGVRATGGGALPAAGSAAILLPAGADGPAWLAYPNFRVIKRYNNATSYALAVSLLAEEIGGGEGVAGLSWPRGDRALSRTERETLQRALTARGFDTGGVDGLIGPQTRAALRAFQASEGLVADGYASEAMLRRVLGPDG